MKRVLKKYINIDPKILGGTPVIAGTRIPIERIYELIKQGYSTETLQREYPQVETKKIHSLIAYLVEAGLNEFEKNYKKV